jgi:hypothetical protein
MILRRSKFIAFSKCVAILRPAGEAEVVTASMNKCPYCKQPAISFWRKQRLGPLSSAICRSCGKKIGVPISALLTSIPFLIILILSLFFIRPWYLTILTSIIGFSIMAFLYHKYVPLIKLEK